MEGDDHPDHREQPDPEGETESGAPPPRSRVTEKEQRADIEGCNQGGGADRQPSMPDRIGYRLVHVIKLLRQRSGSVTTVFLGGRIRHPRAVLSRPDDQEHPGEAGARRPRGTLGSGGSPTGTYRFDRTKAARRGLLDRHAAARPCRGSLHIGHVFSYTHTDTDRPLPADARQGGLLPDGLGRQRPAHRAPGAELLRGALRPDAALRPGLPAPPDEPSEGPPIPISRRNFIELCDGLTAEDEQAFEDLWRTLGLSVDWDSQLRHDRRPQPAHQPAGLPAQPGPGRGLPARGPDAVGRRLPDGGRPGRAGGPGAARRLPPDRLPTARTVARSSSTPPGPS